jgi:hypothetical protein
LSHAHMSRPTRFSCVICTTAGTSAALWYAAYGVPPTRAAGNPAFSKDQWSLAWSKHTYAGMPSRRAR